MTSRRERFNTWGEKHIRVIAPVWYATILTLLILLITGVIK